ncbi:MAG: LCP family protein [Actinobacteria bacterium]|nr:LCP family protein [Actinomycetota bacterium]
MSDWGGPDDEQRRNIDPRAPLPPGLDPRGRMAAHAAARQRVRDARQAKAEASAQADQRLGRATSTALVLPRNQVVRDRLTIGTRVVAALASLAVLIGSFWVWSTWRQFKADIPHGAAIAPSDNPTKDIDGKDQNILLLGNDSRAGATAAELQALGTQDDGGSANTDTMMLMHIPANGSKASVISFPRDSYVAIPGHGMDKLNAAFPDGYNAARGAGQTEVQAESSGITLLAGTLSQLTGLHIDHYVMINLLGFYRISNAIGGVPVLLCQAQKEANSGINLPAGLSTISGTQALAFVRQRYGFADGLGDLDRIKRQQYFLTQVFHSLTSSGVLLNPLKIKRLLDAVSSSLLTDPSIDILGLAADFQQMSAGNLTFQTVPTDGFANESVGSVVVVHPADVQAFAQQLVGGSTSSAASATPLAGAKTVAPSSVTVDVLNGSNENGTASRNADTLRQLGFTIGKTGNSSTVDATTINYPAGLEDQAKTLLAAIPSAKVQATSSVSRVTLVLGTDNMQVGGSSPAPSSGSAVSATPTASASKAAGPATGVPGAANQPGCIN